ncbi:hypothetical protein [Persicobacter psychrovividus]|uniref:Transporter n=1 Tax=Persicobacter psychrovividus TaxID=387638 RepID=A0ABN6LIW2_9BACT|nr:hypothetical protein PEPS_38390 [Persicobacter psychrovividus]
MNRLYYLLLLLILPFSNVIAQGCSDAGVCTLASHNFEEDLPKNTIGIGLGYGIADNDVTVITPFLEYARSINSQWSVSLKLTAQGANSDVANTFGMGDLFATLDYRLPQLGSKFTHRFALGGKFNLSSPDLTDDNNEPLPMVFQPTLGTIDLLLAYHIGYKHWEGSLYLQQPISGANTNAFLGNTSGIDMAENYPNSNMLNRKGDLLLRVAYNIMSAGDRLKIQPSILPILHLGEDEITNDQGDIVSVEGSDGLTLNGSIIVEYQIKNTQAVYINLGSPFINREVIPDGLKRGLVAIAGYRFQF